MEEIKKTLGTWALEQNIRLLDEKYYKDENLYTIEEYSKIVPRNIEVPLNNDVSNEVVIQDDEIVKVVNNDILINPDFIEKYRNFKKLQLEMDLMEKDFKAKLKEAMEMLGKDKFIVNGFSAKIKAGYTKNTFDSKRFEKECPDIYNEYKKETSVSSSIIIEVE